MSPPTIVVFDDSEPFRRALRAVAAAAGCVVVGEADRADQAPAVLAALDRPDLVLVDVNLGTSSGIDLARQLAVDDPALRIVLVSTMEERDLPSQAHDAGSIGFIEKSELGPEVLYQLTKPAARPPSQ